MTQHRQQEKLYCGDYQSLDNAKLCIDRKKDLQELCGNVCQQHERFKAELIRAREAGIQLPLQIVALPYHLHLAGVVERLEDYLVQ